jgi:hypothetical protein
LRAERERIATAPKPAAEAIASIHLARPMGHRRPELRL